MPDIKDYILRPRLLNSLQQDIPPVRCVIWKGRNTYETVEFDKVYPFDTINDIKRMICAHYYPDTTFHPKFLFVGIPYRGEEMLRNEEKGPDEATTYLPVDYLWYANGSSKPEDVHRLQNPLTNLQRPDTFFFTPDGSWKGPARETRGRATIEHVFLKPNDGEIPVLHVFPIRYLLQAGGQSQDSMPEEDWNKYYGPYYVDIPIKGPYRAEKADNDFTRKIKFYVEQRMRGLYQLDERLQEGIGEDLKEQLSPTVEGVRQLRLIWKKPVAGFEGCGSMFYRIHVTQKRPYIRLLPADGSPITKLHVEGVIPIPTLEDPTLLESWGKEISPDPASDFCVIKYLQQSATVPIYGTIHVFNDGTINLLLQPPKGLKRLDSSDFFQASRTLEEVMEGLPQDSNEFELQEVAVTLSFKTDIQHTRFTKEKVLQRLPYFQTFFQEIPSLPNESPILSLRYKAVSQFAAEDKYFTFLTLLDTKLSLQGEVSALGMIEGLENEFLLPREMATEIYTSWLTKGGQFSLEVPEEGEFMKLNNPGIDIHIYEQHPLYYFHINRIDSYETYRRIYTLLCMMFMEGDDDYQIRELNRNEALERVSEEIHHEERKEEEGSAASQSIENDMEPDEGADSIPDDLMDMFMRGEAPIKVGEVIPESAPSAIAASSSPAPAPSAAAQAPLGPAQPIKKGLVDPNQWFLKKLQAMDDDLFGYKPAKGTSGYSRKCGAVEDRQPVIMTKNQYQRLRDIYKDTPHIHWIEYPLTGSEEPIQPAGTELTITVMKYGSSPKNIHYYFCPEYYCLLDELMILQRDFEGTKDWYGHRKEPNTCPFCHGHLITGEQQAARLGYTVVRRTKTKTSGRIHDYIGFLASSTHPKQLALPCCFTIQKTLRLSDKRFAEIRQSLMDLSIQQLVERREGEEEINAARKSMSLLAQKEEQEDLVYRSEDAMEYAILFQQLHEKNFLEPNKTLKPKNVGAAPPQFDAYFHQDSFKNIVHRVKVYLTLQANAHGFIRVGTPNPVNESLLGVIAPLIDKNTIGEVKRRLLEVMVPRVFLNSHFGNLVLEFYNPTDKEAMPATYQELKTWSENNLGISISSTNTYQLLRIYNSYQRFVQFIKDEKQRKDLRHIQPILAEPGLLTPRGLQLIVLEDHGDTKPVTVKCPTFGVSMDRNRKNDMAFVSRSIRTIAGTKNNYAHYELYVHTSNKPPKGAQGPIHETILKWNHQQRNFWPNVVEERIDEYLTKCQSRYRSLFTSQDGISPMAMIPLSKAVEATSDLKPYGIVKDSYNHVVGLTFHVTKAPGSIPLVTLPVVDDGVISISSAFSIKHIHLDWEDYKAAPTEDIVAFYRDKLSPLFALYPGYTVQHKVVRTDEDRVVAIQLANGIYIPASPGKDSLNTVKVKEFQWSLDKEIAGVPSRLRAEPWSEVLEGLTKEERCGLDSELVHKSSYVEFEELYQQFRLMVSNWLSEGGEVKKQVEKIIFNRDLPTYEKRKRMDIFLSSTLQSWFYPDKKPWSAPVTFLRKDCRVIDSPTACSGTCVWKEGSNGGKCLLHVDAMTPLKGREVSTPELFTKRVLDELVRFPARRKQLLTRGDISKVSKIMEPIRQGDEYIIPESSPTWTNLLRLEWTTHVVEKPEYYEEMSRKPEVAKEEREEEEEKHAEDGLGNDSELTPRDMPPELLAILGKRTPLRLHVPAITDETQPLLPFMALLGVTFERVGLGRKTDTPILGRDNLIKYVRTTTRPIGIIELRKGKEQGALFVKPEGFIGAVSILVYLPNQQVGILMDPNGESAVEVDNIPDSLKQAWKDALVVKRPSLRIQNANEHPPLVAMLPKKELLRIPYANEEPAPAPVPAPAKAKPKVKIPYANEEPASIPESVPVKAKPKVKIPYANEEEGPAEEQEQEQEQEQEKEQEQEQEQEPIQEEPQQERKEESIVAPPEPSVKPKRKLHIQEVNQVPTLANRTLRRVRFANEEEGKSLAQPKTFFKNAPVSNLKRNKTKRKLRNNLFV